MDDHPPGRVDLEPCDVFMPLHLRLKRDGTITHVGPTLRKMRPEDDLLGRSLFEVFDLVRVFSTWSSTLELSQATRPMANQPAKKPNTADRLQDTRTKTTSPRMLEPSASLPPRKTSIYYFSNFCHP